MTYLIRLLAREVGVLAAADLDLQTLALEGIDDVEIGSGQDLVARVVRGALW